MIEAAKKYHELGLSVIPIGADKRPKINEETLYAWKKHQEKLIPPGDFFNSAIGIGLVCGNVSGGIEVIDIDCKYDTTGKLYEEFKALIMSADANILKKMVVQSTQNGGYHFIYRCETTDGNLKLAERPTTEAEKIISPKEKVKVLIETRGNGGYIAIHPTKGYKITYGSLEKISCITNEERDVLLVCAKSFTQIHEQVIEKKEVKEIAGANKSPFEDFNERGDVLNILESEGWVNKLQKKEKNYLLRPGGTGAWSAEYDSQRRLFYVWTSSSEFENEKAYNPVQVLATLRFNKDYSSCAKWLMANGYGERTEKIEKRIPTVIGDEDSYEFLATNEETDEFIYQKRNGTFKMGNLTGFHELDGFFRFKPNQLNMILGHDNVGKSVVSWYLAVLDCLFNNELYIIFSGENKTGMVKLKLMEYYLCKPIVEMNDEEFMTSKTWVEEKFALIKTDEAYSYHDMIEIGKRMLKRKRYTKFIIEPYNVLDKKTTNEHQYDYVAMRDLRLFIKKTGIGILLNVHAVTEALRRIYPKEHQYGGYTMPPNKADTEGGGKFTNKADDFLVIHRMTDHETEWMWTEIHVKKVKEMETGGKPTLKDAPFKIRMCKGGCGFEDRNGYNPVLSFHGLKSVELPLPKLQAVESFYEPKENDIFTESNQPAPF